MHMSQNSHRNWKLWNHGADLYFAPQTFISEIRKAEIRVECEEMWKTSLDQMKQASDQIILGPIVNTISLNTTGVVNFSFDRECRKTIKSWLQRGQLLGLGFAFPRQPADQPEFLPIDMWDGKIDWRNSSLAKDGLRYMSIKIVNARQLVDQSSFKETSTIGRPTRSDHIVVAFHSLFEAGEIVLRSPMSQNYQPVRSYVMAHHPNENQDDTGLGDKVMQKIVNPLIKDKLLKSSKL